MARFRLPVRDTRLCNREYPKFLSRLCHSNSFPIHIGEGIRSMAFSFHFRISHITFVSHTHTNWRCESIFPFRMRHIYFPYIFFIPQWGHLDVVVPPDILDDPESNGGSMDEGITNEGGQIQLLCIATGVPPPTVSATAAAAAAPVPALAALAVPNDRIV